MCARAQYIYSFNKQNYINKEYDKAQDVHIANYTNYTKKMYLQEYKLKKLITNQKSITHTRPTPKSKLK